MTRLPRSGTVAHPVTIRATAAERRAWERAAKIQGHATLSDGCRWTLNAWAKRALKGPKK